MDTRKKQVSRTCRAEVTTEAPIESVWRVISDVTRTGEWSHECHQVTWLGGAAVAAPGARFRGRNRSGWLRWSRTCEILAVDPPLQIAWRTIPTPLFVDSTDWRITLAPAGAGTQIVQAFQVTKCPRWWEWIVARVNPRHIDRSAALTDDLHRIAPPISRGDSDDHGTHDPDTMGNTLGRAFGSAGRNREPGESPDAQAVAALRLAGQRQPGEAADLGGQGELGFEPGERRPQAVVAAAAER